MKKFAPKINGVKPAYLPAGTCRDTCPQQANSGRPEAVCPQGIGRCAGRIGAADSPRHTSFPSQCR